MSPVVSAELDKYICDVALDRVLGSGEPRSEFLDSVLSVTGVGDQSQIELSTCQCRNPFARRTWSSTVITRIEVESLRTSFRPPAE
jgi:hypothetical protein